MPEREELQTGALLRLGRRNLADRFFPNGLAPDTDDFGLSDEEKAVAQQPGGTGSLSVWDAELTTPVQAHAFLGSPEKTRIVLELQAQDIRSLPHDLHIFKEPETRPLPGREGHCVVEDVWSPDKRKRKAIQSDLVSKSQVRGRVGPEGFTPI